MAEMVIVPFSAMTRSAVTVHPVCVPLGVLTTILGTLMPVWLDDQPPPSTFLAPVHVAVPVSWPPLTVSVAVTTSYSLTPTTDVPYYIQTYAGHGKYPYEP